MTPLRRCVACGRCGEKESFFRVVRLKDGHFQCDGTGRMNGRGAYVCRERACLETARKKNGFARSFRQAVPGEIYEQLERMLGE